MGLDNYAQPSEDEDLSEEDVRAFEQAGISLCCGVLSGDGSDGCFRGKVYQEDIFDITGVSLVREWIPPDTVKEMYQALVEWDTSESEILELRKFFKVCAERNLGLRGSS